jgi:hypothetical protein
MRISSFALRERFCCLQVSLLRAGCPCCLRFSGRCPGGVSAPERSSQPLSVPWPRLLLVGRGEPVLAGFFVASVFIHGAQSLLGLLGFWSSLCAFAPVGFSASASLRLRLRRKCRRVLRVGSRRPRKAQSRMQQLRFKYRRARGRRNSSDGRWTIFCKKNCTRCFKR